MSKSGAGDAGWVFLRFPLKSLGMLTLGSYVREISVSFIFLAYYDGVILAHQSVRMWRLESTVGGNRT